MSDSRGNNEMKDDAVSERSERTRQRANGPDDRVVQSRAERASEKA
jgi:hypothetical protein